MMKMAMSPAARALLRALVVRAGGEQNRILLTESVSADWQSLTFTGERHWICLRITGSDSTEIAGRIIDGIEDAEFNIPGVLVADIAVVEPPRRASDCAIELAIEALTILND